MNLPIFLFLLTFFNLAPKINFPIEGFNDRISKKPFGIYISPKTSPIQPEKFTGYHTGVDIEYGDANGEVSVYSISNGSVVRSEWVSGYGGMTAIKYLINNQSYVAIYGHLDPDRLLKKGAEVKVNQQIGVLGQGYSRQNDGERKHLHFAIHKGNTINVRGYVQKQSDLSEWINPAVLFK